MYTSNLVAAIDAEIAKLHLARTLLERVGANLVKKAPGKQPKKRVLSAEARAKIAEAQRRRWAKAKKKA